MGKSWKRRQQRLRNKSAREAVENILTTTASMSQTIEEVISTMKPVEPEPVVSEPVVATATPVKKRRARSTRTTTARSTRATTVVDPSNTTD